MADKALLLTHSRSDKANFQQKDSFLFLCHKNLATYTGGGIFFIFLSWHVVGKVSKLHNMVKVSG